MRAAWWIRVPAHRFSHGFAQHTPSHTTPATLRARTAVGGALLVHPQAELDEPRHVVHAHGLVWVAQRGEVQRLAAAVGFQRVAVVVCQQHQEHVVRCVCHGNACQRGDVGRVPVRVKRR